MEYAQSIRDLLLENGVRAEMDDRNEKIGKKIRDAEMAKIPYMLIIGEKEMNENKVSLRVQGKGDTGQQSPEEFLQKIKAEIAERKSAE